MEQQQLDALHETLTEHIDKWSAQKIVDMVNFSKQWEECTSSEHGPCLHAIKNGYLECLKYACENGCPIDIDNCIAKATLNHYPHTVNYLKSIT